jgi:hypothetical protein
VVNFRRSLDLIIYSNGSKLNGEWKQIRKNFDGNGRFLMEVLSRNLPGGTEENDENYPSE